MNAPSQQAELQRTTTLKLVTVIINPVSCSTGLELTRQQMIAKFATYGVIPNFVETLESTPATNIALEAIRNGAELIVAAGGDGTIMEAVNALVGSTIPIAIIPLGTGNLLALNLGLPLSIDGAIETAMTGEERLIDLVKVNGGQHYFAIMGGIGFDAQVMDDTDRASKQRFGRLAYIWTAIKNLEGNMFEARIQIDDHEPITDDLKSILIANMGLIGPNFSAFPDALPDDGFIRVGLLKASSATEFIRLVATAVAEGTPEPDPAFDVYTCKSVRVWLKEPQLYEYDGDLEGTITELFAEISPKSLRIMSPADK
jgi:diacylglycerol kinase (ATP)